MLPLRPLQQPTWSPLAESESGGGGDMGRVRWRWGGGAKEVARAAAPTVSPRAPAGDGHAALFLGVAGSRGRGGSGGCGGGSGGSGGCRRQRRPSAAAAPGWQWRRRGRSCGARVAGGRGPLTAAAAAVLPRWVGRVVLTWRWRGPPPRRPVATASVLSDLYIQSLHEHGTGSVVEAVAAARRRAGAQLGWTKREGRRHRWCSAALAAAAVAAAVAAAGRR